MRADLTGELLRALFREIAKSAPSKLRSRVFVVGGGTAVLAGWRPSSVDADLHSDQEEVFRDIQRIKELLNVNVEFTRPEHFVPALPGSADRHVFIESIGRVEFLHYDPYAQALAKIVRGFRRDVEDATHFIESGMVDPVRLRSLVDEIPEASYAKYPQLSRVGVVEAVDAFLGRPAP